MGPKHQEAGEAPPLAPRAGGERVRILLVEDNLDEREALAALLEQVGYQVDRAIDGEDALELARSFAPDLALVDLSMPRMDGFELAQRLKNLPAASRMPIIAVTARTISPSAVLGRGPFTDVFFKPVAGAAFLEFVRVLAKVQARGPGKP